MPLNVLWFERLMYASLGACAWGFILYAQRAEEPLSAGGMLFLLLFIVVAGSLLAMLIWLVARGRRNWARYVICALYVLSVPHFMRQTLVMFRSYPFEDMLAWAQFVMAGVACVLIFSGDARQWFAQPQA